MNMKWRVLFFVGSFSLWLLSGCATSYQKVGLKGGYSETQLAPDLFRVNFNGNGYTSSERAQDFALLRAAELSLQRGVRYFALLDESSSNDFSTYTTSGSAWTNGTYMTYQPGQRYFITKPHVGFPIKGFPNKQSNIYTLDAEFLQQSIKQKYNLH